MPETNKFHSGGARVTNENKKGQTDFREVGLAESKNNNSFNNSIGDGGGCQPLAAKAKVIDFALRQDRPFTPGHLLALRSKMAKEAFGIPMGRFKPTAKGLQAKFEAPHMDSSVGFFLRIPEGCEPLDGYDQRVLQAACAVIDFFDDPEARRGSGLLSPKVEIPFTITDIYRGMGHPGKRPGSKERERIGASIRKLSSARINLCWGSEMEAMGADPDEIMAEYGAGALPRDLDLGGECELNEWVSLLPCRDCKVIPFNGRNFVEGFAVEDFPPLYSYSKLTRQFAPIPVDWFTAFKRQDDRRSALVWDVGEKIATAYYYREAKGSDPNRSNYNVVSLQKILASIDAPNRMAASRMREDAEALLSEYKARGLISGFQYEPNGSIRFFIPYEEPRE